MFKYGGMNLDMEKGVKFNVIWTNLRIKPIHWALNAKEMNSQNELLNVTFGTL